MHSKRLVSVLAVLVMTMLLFVAYAGAETEEDVIVLSAPLVRSTTVKNGMVRVWLSSMGTPSKLDVTVTGNYSVNGNTAMSLSDGDQVTIRFDSVTGKMTMTMNGNTYAMGQEMRLRRHQADDESALSIAQVKRPANYYPGDLQLLAVKQSNGTYRMYPIVHVYLESYLYGVVPYEMSSSWPIEALKAQAVAARTYTVRRVDGRTAYTYDLTDTTSDQVYYGHTGSTSSATRAVDATKGIVIMNDGVLSGTYYTASNGGQTEAVKNAWGSSGYPYLGVKNDPFDASNTASIRRKLTVYSDFDHPAQNEALAEMLSEAITEELGANAVIETIDSITPHTPKYAAPSRLYTMMDFGVTALVGKTYVDATLSFSIFNELEAPLGMNINSSTKNELWTAEKTADGFLITVGRWGHGIGMSQRGAQQMARLGYSYDQILGFYYEGCKRVQYTFMHTILSAGSSNEVVTTEAPATITPADQTQATLSLSGMTDVAPLRYTASRKGKILTGIPNGAALTVLAKGTDWTLVRYGEINGYLPTSWLLFVGAPPATSDEKATLITLWGTVTGTNALNFRTGPGYDYDIKTELSFGTLLCILDGAGEWVKVQWGSEIGYVAPSYLTMHSTYPGTVSGDNVARVNLQSGEEYAPLLAVPSTSAQAIMYLPDGVQVTVLSNDGTWCLVETAGKKGYLLTSQLAIGEQGNVTPPDEEEPTDSPSVPPEPTPNESTAWVMGTVNYVNLRQTADPEGKIITTIPSGDELTVLEKGTTWSYVRHGSTTGYVLSRNLTYSKPLPAIGVMYINTQTDPLALRDRPSTSGSTVLTRVPKGASVMLLEDLGGWCRVQYYAHVGYCSSEYLSRSKPSVNDVDDTPLFDPTLKAVENWSARVNTAQKQELIIYKWCSMEAPEIMKIRYDVLTDLLEQGDIWCKIKYKGETGYCLTKELKLIPPAE